MYVSGFWVTSIAFQSSCNRCPSSSEYPQVRRFSALDTAESATAKNVTVSVYSVPFIMGFPHRCCQKRREAVTLPEVRDALFRDYMQGGNHRLSICLPIPFIIVPAHRHSLAGVPSSSSSMYSFLRKEGAESALVFSRPGTSREPQEASGVTLALLHWSAAPHSSQVSRGCLEKPSMKSKAESQ